MKLRQKHGFTLIELLVVIAIIALLIAILLPTISAAREQAKAAACGVQLRATGNLLQIYANNNRDFIPGMNTSGVAVRCLQGSPIQQFHNARLPVQPHDWISPILRQDTTLPDKRALRFQLITQYFSCPSQRGIDSQLYGSAGDLADFQQISPWSTLSYLMPVHFQYWGQKDKDRVLAPNRIAPTLPVRSLAAPTNWEIDVQHYTSKIDQVGPPATKIAIADGTRYLSENATLDHDISQFPTYFGSFTSSGAWWSGSSEYGVRESSRNWSESVVVDSSPSNGQNLPLSYRHSNKTPGTTCDSNRGTINALFFDTHVQRLTDKESRDVRYWYPRGAKINTGYSNGTGLTDVDPTIPIP